MTDTIIQAALKLEPIAIAMYESFVRHEGHRSSDTVWLWTKYKPWSSLETPERQHWREQAKNMIIEVAATAARKVTS